MQSNRVLLSILGWVIGFIIFFSNSLDGDGQPEDGD